MQQYELRQSAKSLILFPLLYDKIDDSFQIFYLFFYQAMAYKILVPWLGIELTPWVVKAWSPNPRMTRAFPDYSLSKSCLEAELYLPTCINLFNIYANVDS